MLQLSVMLVMPIVTANSIDAIPLGDKNAIIINLSVAVFLMLINYPMQRLYMKSRNDVTRCMDWL